MDRFNLHHRHEDFFEDLVWHLCAKLFGLSTKKFAAGKDGAKDALFEGTAEKYPSTAKPWEGKVVIQAKHTKNPIASCSDSEFKTLMNREEARVKKLKKAGDLDHYICFTNRKYSGVKGDALQKQLRKDWGIPTLTIVGLETIERLLTEYTELIDKLGIGIRAPGLTLHPQDLEKLIHYFDENVDIFSESAHDEKAFPFSPPILEPKNKLNRLSPDYFSDMIVEDSMAHFGDIQDFLKNPRNVAWRKRYTNVATQFRNKYHAHRSEFGAFEYIFDDIFDRLKVRGQLPDNDRLVYIFLHFMYCTCDLGQRAPRKTT